MANDTPRIPELAYYFGDLIWDEELTDWIKSLPLFFDGIALALPPERADRLIEANPVLVQPLAELGLLRNYEPDLWLKSEEQVPPDLERYLNRVGEILARIPAWSCWLLSRPGRAGPPIRCCRPAWCWTLTAAAPICRCSSPEPGCSAPSSS